MKKFVFYAFLMFLAPSLMAQYEGYYVGLYACSLKAGGSFNGLFKRGTEMGASFSGTFGPSSAFGIRAGYIHFGPLAEYAKSSNEERFYDPFKGLSLQGTASFYLFSDMGRRRIYPMLNFHGAYQYLHFYSKNGNSEFETTGREAVGTGLSLRFHSTDDLMVMAAYEYLFSFGAPGNINMPGFQLHLAYRVSE